MHALTKPLSALALTQALVGTAACTGEIDHVPGGSQPGSANGAGSGHNTSPANAFPGENSSNGFGIDADQQAPGVSMLDESVVFFGSELAHPPTRFSTCLAILERATGIRNSTRVRLRASPAEPGAV